MGRNGENEWKLNDHNNVKVKLYIKAESKIGSKDMRLKKEKKYFFSKFDYLTINNIHRAM